MTKREAGFFLLGLFIGLACAVAVLATFAMWLQNTFILAVRWKPITLGLAVLGSVLFTGLALVRRRTHEYN